MDAFQQVLNNLVQFYSEMADCRAIALIGSRATESAKSWSDVNLMLVMFRLPGSDVRAEMVRNLTGSRRRTRCVDRPFPSDRFEMGGFVINAWYISQDLICDRVASVTKGRRLETTMLVALLHDCRILWDKNNQLHVWRSRISPVPINYRRTVIPVMFAEITAVIEDIAKAYKKEESLFFIQHEIMAALRVLYEMVFLVNDRYLNLTRRIDSDISGFRRVPDEFQARVNEILIGPSDSEGVRRKWRLLAEFIRHVGRFLEEIDPQIRLSIGWSQLRKAAPFVFKDSEGVDTGKFKVIRRTK